MGRRFFNRGEYNLPISSFTRCINCNKLILFNDIIPHVRKCSKLFIDNFNNNINAKRFHIIFFTLGLEDNISKNFVYNEEMRLFTLQFYENLCDVRDNYPYYPWRVDLFNLQELFILDSLLRALIDYEIRVPVKLLSLN